MATAKKLSKKPARSASTPPPSPARTNGKSTKLAAAASKAVPKPTTAKAAATAPAPGKTTAAEKTAAVEKPKRATKTKAASTKPAAQPKSPPARPPEKIAQAGGITTDAVARRTGKGWGEWFALLDSAGARDLDHKGIVAVLAQRHGVGPWWQQMITVAYEQHRGKSDKDETPDGYQVGATLTLQAPLRKIFKMWVEAEERRKWLADDRFSISKATSGKSIRARWGRGTSRIDVFFVDKGEGKSQVNVQHNQIDTPEAAEQMKAYWGKKLGALEEALGS
jgi:hypothetical protein